MEFVWDRGIIAREHHKDGEVHFHVFIHAKLCSQVQLVRIKHEDLELFGKRGNYQDARSDKAVVKYCTKEGDFIWWGQDPNVRSMLREGKAKLSLSSVVSGDMSLVDLVESDPRTLLHLDQLKKNLALFLSLKKTRIAKVPTLMYLFGPSGVGKTTLARSFAEEKEIYMVPMPPKAQTPFWFDGYSGHECLVFDNVSKEISPPYDLICRMVDVSGCMLPVKGGLVDCHPAMIIITSTVPPEILWGPLWDVQMKRRTTALGKPR